MAPSLNSFDAIATPEPTGISVLIAHRDPLISAGLSATLREQQFTVVAQALPSLDESPPGDLTFPTDVVVSDYEAGLRLLGLRELWRERVIILTDRDSQSSICQALEQGVGGYLLLGCSVAALVGAIRSVHRGKRALDPLVAARMAERLTQPLLTRREAEVLRQINCGLSNKGIGLRLSLSVGTVKAHVKSIFAKLGAVSRTHAVAMARRRGVLPEEGESIPGSGKPDGTVRLAIRRVVDCVSTRRSLLEWITPRAQMTKERSQTSKQPGELER